MTERIRVLRSHHAVTAGTGMLLAVAALTSIGACSSGGAASGPGASGSDASVARDSSSLDAAIGPQDGAGDSSATAVEGGTEAEAASPPRTLTASGPVTIRDQDGGVLSGLKITSAAGDCVTIDSTFGFTLRASEIGPCAGNAVVVRGGGEITIEDSYIHPEHPPAQCCDTGDGVFATGTTSLSILGNVIAYGEANIEVQQTTGVTVIGNFLLNPQNGGSRGQNFQSWSGCSQVDVERNYALSSLDPEYTLPAKQEDSINFGQTNGVIARGNYVTGGLSVSGCGIIADDEADSVQFIDNVLLDTGQCGIGVASGTDQTISGNQILDRDPVDGGGNTALYVWNQYPGVCGPVSIVNNVISGIKPDGTPSSYWNGGGCGTVTLTGNTFDQDAAAMLTPPDQKIPPPKIPPVPVACVAPSPYSTQTGFPSCGQP
ncbi:MAG: right-handed parallel beta-helix repeat-containing protein [Polyangiaceae bacterium]